jgi:hypothetical protein
VVLTVEYLAALVVSCQLCNSPGSSSSILSHIWYLREVFYWILLAVNTGTNLLYVHRIYDRQQWIEGINAPIWPQVFAPQNANVFVPDLYILDSELQFLVLLIPNYSFWFCTAYS